MKSLLTGLTALSLAVSLGAPAAIAQDKGTIGIAMPTKSSARWISDGDSMVAQFEAAGYTADLQYAEDDIPNQLAQIENMITKEVDALVIAAIDGTTLSNALANAAALDIPVIASGGVGTLEHLVEGVTEGGADAVLAASIFHFGEHTVGEAKEAMAAAGIEVRRLSQ